MERRLPIRLFVATLVVAAFAACSGGGDTGGSLVPGSSRSGAGSTTSSTTRQQGVVSSALAIAGNGTTINSFGTTGGAMTFAIRRAIDERGHADALPPSSSPSPSPSPSPTIACDNGVEFSQTASGTGTFDNTIEYFYDSACTQPRRLITFAIALSGTGGTVTGTEELWDSSGNVVDYKADDGSFITSGGRLSQLTLERSVAAAPSATPFAENGISCVFAAGTAVDCGNANVATINTPQWDPHIYATMTPAPGASPSSSPSTAASPTASPTPFEIGFSGTVVGTQTTPSPSASATPSGWGWNPQSVQLQFTIAGTGYTGAVQSMTIASPAPGVTPPAWTIAGGTQAATLSGTATLGFGQSGMFQNTNITLNDTADGLTITFTSASRGGLTGTMTNSSGQAVATVTVDANGDGVIDYTTGATAQIRDWIILST